MRLKPKRRRVPKEFRNAVKNGYDYDSHMNIEENRIRTREDGFEEFGDKMDDTFYKDWLAAGAELGRDHAKAQWNIGDWLNGGFQLRELNDGDRHSIYGMAAEVTGLKIPTLRVYAHVARSVNSNIRDYSLNFAQHQLVASLPEEKQRQALAGMHFKSVEMSRTWLNLPSTRASLKLDENNGRPPKNPKPKTPGAGDIRKTKAMIRLCDQLLESLSKYRPAAATPAAMWTLHLVAASALEVAEKIEAASISTDAGR